jgi:hypothetical protein
MPGTAKDLGVDPTDPVQSANGAGRYLHQMLTMFGGDTEKAIAAYNMGPGALQKDIAKHGSDWRSYLPVETKDYLSGTLQTMSNSGGDALGAGPRPGSNIPAAALAAEAAAKAGAMSGSETSFNEMNTIIPVVNKSLSDFGRSVDAAKKTLDNFNRVPMNGGVNPFLMTPP